MLVPTSSVGFLLRCAIFVDRVRCGCRGCFPMVYCHCVVREDEHGIGSSGFLSLVFLTRFPLRLTPTSSLVSTLIATTGVLLILSLRPIAHGSLLSTRLASSALPMADGARCFYAYYLCGELGKTAPTDAIISNRQSINQCPCLVSPPPRPSCRRAGRDDRCLLGGVSFPVIFVYFRFALELSIFSGIIWFSCVVLLAYWEVFPFPFRHHSAWPRCSCRARSGDIIGDVIMMSSVSAVCLLTPRVMFPVVFASPFPVRPSSSRLLSPLFVSWDGEPTGLLACLVMSCLRRRGRGHALDVERCRGLSAVPRSPLPSPLLRIG